MRRNGRLRRGTPPRRRATLRRGGRLARRKPLRRAPFSPASEEQRIKVAGRACLRCGGRPVDPAHLVPRALGGCEEADCVVALCRACHRAFDRRELDLLVGLEPGHRRELAHALSHMPLVRLIERITGERWAPIEDGDHGRHRDA